MDPSSPTNDSLTKGHFVSFLCFVQVIIEKKILMGFIFDSSKLKVKCLRGGRKWSNIGMWQEPPASLSLIFNYPASFSQSLLWRPIQPQRWRKSMWKVTVICGIMFSQERLPLYLVLIYRPCHLRKPPSLLTQGKEVWFILTVCKFSLGGSALDCARS